MIVSITRLRLRAWRYLPQFLWLTMATLLQARRSEGFNAGRLFIDQKLTFWTLSIWQDEKAMRSYMMKEPHRGSMARTQVWCDEVKVCHWSAETAEFPTWGESYAQLQT